VLNPIRHVAKLGLPVKKLSREQQGIARRVARFEASRLQEGPMGIQLQDMNPVAHQTKATFTPGKSTAPPAPPQPALAPLPPKGPIVQRVARQLEQPGQLEPDGFAELEAEFGQGTPKTVPAPELTGDEADIDAYLKRFKGTPDELVKQLAKSGVHAEKRMRHLEAEKNLLVKGQPMQTVQPQGVAPAVMPQIQPQPQFKYERFKNDILDHGDQVAKDFEAHLSSSLDQKVVQVVAPLYEEAMDNRLFRKFGDVVTEENLDIIKAMAQSEPGETPWAKRVNAVTKYKASMPQTTTTPNAEVTAMQQAAQTPTPQARPIGEKKMFKQSYLRDLMETKVRSGEYQRDPKWRNLIETAYREGRVLRGQ